MYSEPSTSQPTIGLSGSGALSHVYIQYPNIRCNIPDLKGLFYDDGNKLLLSPTSNEVWSWKVVPFDPNVAPSSDPISEGPVLSIRYSLDAKILAIQRSDHEIQLWNKETGETFSQKCRPESESILGFFWTDCPTCDIVFVKTSGLDLFTYDSELKSLRLVESKRMIVTWYIYTHESRLVLLASGLQCKSFAGFQLSSAGIVRLPKFEMVMAKSEANSKPVLAAEDVRIITVYGRIYCLQVDRVAMLLHSYRFYRDAIVPQGSLPIYSSKIGVSVVDNVLLVHQVDAKVVILYDLFSDSSAPISAPLPLLLRAYPRAKTLSFRLPDNDNVSSEVTKEANDQEPVLYGDGWTFLVPDLICDSANGLLWKINLDLEAISASSSEAPSVIEFLQRRKLEAKKAKQLCLAITRTIMLEHRPVSVVARVMDILITAYSRAIKTDTYLKGMKPEKSFASSAPQVSSPTFDADESSKRVGLRGKSVSEFASGVAPVNQSSRFSGSDSEERASFEPPKDNSSEIHLVGGAVGKDILIGAETPYEKVQQSQFPVSSSIALDANISEQPESSITSAAISPDEIYRFVFAPVDEEMAGDPAYLVSIIVEFLRSANMERIAVYPNLYVLTAQLLARSQRYAELGLFIINKIIEPSKEVAYQLIESGRQNLPTRKLGMDMLRQLSLHDDYILSLALDGYYLEALKYVRKHKVNSIRPSLFLEAACSSNNPQHLAAVLRFFSDFIPGFKNTSDHTAYCQILAEMNASVAAA
ncbi:hypothetical protein Nepgr_010060 [Nepenthes gracilis]|uniref:Mic1 domain-containing protein n=1 Tax=Nepenthes gracilis TaxID=150966 RepID=A0AAD3XKZ2_NEPGR|nr:hypothetical protein Nepgr_010060 [Nepenthes gracilis]